MLSQRTVAFLETFAQASNLVYPEGGFLFRYEFAYSQAHNQLSGDLLSALQHDEVTEYAEVSVGELNDMARFFQGALGNYTKDAPSGNAVRTARTLIDYLKEDLQNDLVGLVVEDGSGDMTVSLEMANKATNNYSWLELFWSVD
ncbi:hypothetical protein [Pseudomonas sp. NA-150]|uniref:hypothetical protein n=1 Tax=Pseudomonas sp. NA-150 TaxID=3367525 RepID=UPI0037C7416A